MVNLKSKVHFKYIVNSIASAVIGCMTIFIVILFVVMHKVSAEGFSWISQPYSVVSSEYGERQGDCDCMYK